MNVLKLTFHLCFLENSVRNELLLETFFMNYFKKEEIEKKKII